MAWDEAKNQRFASAWNKGLGVDGLAASFGMKPGAVRKRLSELRARDVELRPGERQAAASENRREKARQRLQLAEKEVGPAPAPLPPPSRFHNMPSPALADEIGRLGALQRQTEAELSALKDEFKRRAIPETRGAAYVIQRQERLVRRLDAGRVRAHFGAAVTAFETSALSVAVTVQPVEDEDEDSRLSPRVGSGATVATGARRIAEASRP